MLVYVKFSCVLLVRRVQHVTTPSVAESGDVASSLVDGKVRLIGIVVGVVCALVLLAFIVVVVCLYHRRRYAMLYVYCYIVLHGFFVRFYCLSWRINFIIPNTAYAPIQYLPIPTDVNI